MGENVKGMWNYEEKLGLVYLMLVCFLIAILLQVSAAEGDSVQLQKVQLKLTYVNIPIHSNQHLVRTETEDSVKVEVFESDTGKLVETYGEIVEKDDANARLAGDYSIVTTYKERTDGAFNEITTRYTVKLNVYTSGSFRQKNSILSTSLAIVNSNFASLESIDTVAISTSGTFPTTAISANATGVLKGTLSYDYLRIYI